MKNRIAAIIIILFILVSSLCTGRYYLKQKNNNIIIYNEKKELTTQDNSSQNKTDIDMSKESTFIKYGDEWLQDDIGIRIKNYYYTDNKNNLSKKYPNTDNWMQGKIGGVFDDDSSVEYRFLTLEITNYSKKDQMLVPKESNTRSFMLKAIKRDDYIVDDTGSIAYFDKNMGNSGQDLHNFGNFKIKAGETITAVYGFMNFVNGIKYDWYLSDSNGGLDQDIRNSPLVTFMCLTEGEGRTKVN